MYESSFLYSNIYHIFCGRETLSLTLESNNFPLKCVSLMHHIVVLSLLLTVMLLPIDSTPESTHASPPSRIIALISLVEIQMQMISFTSIKNGKNVRDIRELTHISVKIFHVSSTFIPFLLLGSLTLSNSNCHYQFDIWNVVLNSKF